MTKPPRIASAEPVIHGVLKLVFTDGYEGVVDVRSIISKGKVIAALQVPEQFSRVRVEEFGHRIYWVDETGYEIDLGADGLRRDCERQAEIHKLMVG